MTERYRFAFLFGNPATLSARLSVHGHMIQTKLSTAYPASNQCPHVNPPGRKLHVSLEQFNNEQLSAMGENQRRCGDRQAQSIRASRFLVHPSERVSATCWSFLGGLAEWARSDWRKACPFS